MSASRDSSSKHHSRVSASVRHSHSPELEEQNEKLKQVFALLGMYRISDSICFLLSGSGSGPVVPRNRISEPDNSSAQMWPINLTKLLVCSGLKPFLG